MKHAENRWTKGVYINYVSCNINLNYVATLLIKNVTIPYYGHYPE